MFYMQKSFSISFQPLIPRFINLLLFVFFNTLLEDRHDAIGLKRLSSGNDLDVVGDVPEVLLLFETLLLGAVL